MTINPTDVRANGSSLRGYVAIFRGAQVLQATIGTDAVALSATSLDITITSGAIGSVQRGYRVQIFSSIGEFKAETHVRWSGTLDATHLPLREFSQSEYLIKALDVVKVFALMAFEDKLVTDTDTFDPDGQSVGTYNSAPRPLAASGGYDAGFVDGYGTGTVLTYRTQTTNGAPSINLDPTSTAGHLTHLWTLPTGVSFAPGSASTNVSPTLRVTQGEYTVYHDVTDSDNSQTWRQCVTYQCFDAAHPPIPCVMESAPQGDPAQGWSCTFRALSFLSLTDAPDGALVLFFVRERINGTWQSLGGTSGRSAVKLVGYLSHDESDLTPQVQYQRFEVISPLARLGQLPGFSKVMFQNATPDDWSKVSTALTTLRAMIQLIRIYTFALDGGHDLLTGTYLLDVPYPELWLQKESPRQQVDELADGVDARLTCTRTGLFRLDPVVALLDLADRAVSTVAYTFAEQDVARLVARRSHFDTVETLELHATSGTNSGDVDDALAYFSRAPGSPGHGADFITIERIIATASSSQDDTNARAGRRYALRNGVYTSSNTGLKGRAPEIDVELRQVYDFLDFDDSIIHFGSFSNPRDLDLTFFDWTLTRVRLDYASGKVISTFTALTDSPPGASYFPPAAAVTIPPPPPIVYPIAPPVTVPPWDGVNVLPTRLIIFDSGGARCHVALSWTPSLSVMNYTAASTGLTGSNIWYCADPWDYDRYFALQTTGLYRNDDPFGGGAWTLVANNATLFGNSGRIGKFISGSINLVGYLAIMCGSHYVYTTDYGATWHDVNIVAAGGGYQTTLDNRGNFELSTDNGSHGGWIYAFIPFEYSDPLYGDNVLYKSTDWGASWAVFWNWPYAGEVHFPYIRTDGVTRNSNDAAAEIYTIQRTGGGENTIHLSQNDGTTWIQKWYLGGGGGAHFRIGYTLTGWTLRSFTYDGARISIAGGSTSVYAAINNLSGALDDPSTTEYDFGAYLGVFGHANRFPTHSQATLFSGATTQFAWTVDDLATISALIDAPAGYVGISQVQWKIDQ